RRTPASGWSSAPTLTRDWRSAATSSRPSGMCWRTWGSARSPSRVSRPARRPAMGDSPFELRVLADGAGGYALALFQRPQRDRDANGKATSWHMVVKVHGAPLKAVIDQVLATLKRAGYKPSDLSRTRTEPFALREDLGVRLGLLLLAVKPL